MTPALAAASLGMLGLIQGCEEKGDFEEAGEEVGDTLEDAGEEIDDAIDDAEDEIDDIDDSTGQPATGGG